MKKFARLAVLLLAILLLPFPGRVSRAETARDLTSRCSFSWSKKSDRNPAPLYDGEYLHYWQAQKAKYNWLEVHLPEGETCSGVQIKWAEINKNWCVEIQRDGEWVPAGGYEADYLTTWTPLPDVDAFRIAAIGDERFARLLVLHELDGGEQTFVAHIADAGVLFLQVLENLAEHLARLCDLVEDVIFLIGVHAGEPGRT